MIYLFSGDDTKKKRTAYEKLLKSVSKETELFFFSDKDFDKDQIKMLYAGHALFSKKNIVIIENGLDKEENKEFIFKNLNKIADAEYDFVFLEGKQPKTIIDKFIKVGGEVNQFNIDFKVEERKHFNIFALTDTFSVRNKLNLWIVFRQAIEKEIPLEEIVGVLFWKAKDMLLKKNFKKFSEKELENFISKISYFLPKVRKEGIDAESALEQFLLEVV